MLGLGASISPVITNMHNQSARSFDGSDQDVNIDGIIAQVADAVRADETEFSISLWCKLSASIGASVTLFKCRNSGSTNNQITLLYHASGNEFRFSPKFGGVNDVCNGGSTNASGDSYEGDGIWHHIVGTVSATDNTNELWIDGVKKESVTGVGTLNEVTNDVSLCQNGEDATYFDGDLKDVAIYGRQLSDSEIGVIYNSGGASGDKGLDLASGSHVSNSELIAHFRFEEKSGTVAINEVGVRTEGSELVTNGDFASDLTGWTGYGTTSATGGIATIGASSNSGIYQGVLTQGVTYTVTLNVTSYDGVGTAQLTNNNGNNIYTITETGIQTFIFTHSIANANLIIRGMSNALFSLSSVSVKQYTTTDGTYVNAPAITTNIP